MPPGTSSSRSDPGRDDLEQFTRDRDDPHLERWRHFWRRVGTSARTGIWHEAYLVRAGEYETIYGNMPPFGLGKAGALLPLAESKTARGRLKVTATAEAVESPVGTLAR